MAQHDRNLIKLADIERFKAWLINNRITWREGKGEYQLMQVVMEKGWGAVCIDASGIVTTPTEIAPLIKQFKSGKPRAAQPVPSAAVTTISDKQYLEDLRDDFAMSAMQGFLSSTGSRDAKRDLITESHLAGVDLPDYIARMSYAMAEAMLAERKKRY